MLYLHGNKYTVILYVAEPGNLNGWGVNGMGVATIIVLFWENLLG